MLQDIWSSKLSWVEAMMGVNGKLSVMKCKVLDLLRKETSCLSQNLMACRNMLGEETIMLQNPM
jgi:hypothetical protein